MKKKETKVRLAKVLGATRFIMGIAVFAIFVGSSVLLLVGTFDMFSGIWETLSIQGESANSELRIVLIEAVDTILISTVLYVIAIGLYQLFIDSSLELPEWLQTKDVSDLEIRLAGMVVTILGVIFMTRAIDFENSKDLMLLGFAVSSVIIAISFFLFQERK